MKIAFLELNEWEEEYLRERIDRSHEFVATLAPDVEIVSPFIYAKLTAEVLAGLPQLKLIATRSTGFDHIDVAECGRRGITVCNVPFYGENTVAEHTFALILALSRKVHEAFVRVRRQFLTRWIARIRPKRQNDWGRRRRAHRVARDSHRARVRDEGARIRCAARQFLGRGAWL